MKTHRVLGTSATLAVAALLACVPAGAQAGSLLSGYGGPGQGSQALIGSTLIGGAGGGSSGSSSGGGSAESIGSLSAVPVRGSGGAKATGGSHRHRATPAASAREHPNRLGRLALAHETGAGTSKFGLSAADLLYIMAVLVGLGIIAGLTRGLARGARPGAPD